ncbi:hypothetical protein QFC22_004771 [Naganishia vaughanmartiniae]|uniref:Uncharacterized protein n=1 Tax=Naganishia vaughanmartiniae TaxID=1424756 RepID=A0ACC2WY30_9TREE|nr:hypothetical protein QFC22_004771 [Naganishia vaughanmartiniae]
MGMSSTKHERHVCWSEEEAVAHFWFPNLKFILETTCDGKQPVNLAWVSARNVQQRDIDCSAALEKLIVDSCAAKPAETSFGGEQTTKSLQQLPLPDFRSHHDPKVWRELAKKGVKLQNSANKPGSPFGQLDTFQQASELSKLARNVAALTFPNIGMISLHILCEFGLDYDLTLAIFRLFLLLNTLYKDKKMIEGQMMNFQLRVGKVESVSQWIDTMVEQEVNPGTLQKHATPPYSLSIYIDPLVGAGCYYPFEKVLLEIRRKLYDRYQLNGYRLRYLPTRLDVMYKHDAGDPDAKRFAIDFGSKVKATFARFGIYHMHCNSFMPLRYYENGAEVRDEERKALLFFSFEDHQSTAFAMEHTEILHPK